METEQDVQHPKRSKKGRKYLRRGYILRFLLFSVLVLGGIYVYQPQRFDLFPRQPPLHTLWTDPESSELFRAGVRVTVITAHPDDAEFYIGGLLARLADSGAQLSLLVTTDGDKGYYPFEDAESNRRTRRREQQEAAHRWNAQEVVFLGYPDGRVKVEDKVIWDMVREIKRLKPEYILTFDPEYPPRLYHQDHWVAGQAGTCAAMQAGEGRWLLHFATRAPNFAFDVTHQWDRRQSFLAVHKSQFYGNRLQRVKGIVTRSAEYDGRSLNVRYAEGFRCERLSQK